MSRFTRFKITSSLKCAESLTGICSFLFSGNTNFSDEKQKKAAVEIAQSHAANNLLGCFDCGCKQKIAPASLTEASVANIWLLSSIGTA